MNETVPWEGVGTVAFCGTQDAAQVVGTWFEQLGWELANAAIVRWASEAHVKDPFATVVRVAFTGSLQIQKCLEVFASMCDHMRIAFEQRSAMIVGWAESVSGHGPTGNPSNDTELWSSAWRFGNSLDDGAPSDGSRLVRDISLDDLYTSLMAGTTGGCKLPFCAEFWDAVAVAGQHDSDTRDEVLFAIARLKNRLAAQGNTILVYASLFSAVIELMHWPAMVRHATEHITGVLCERMTFFIARQAGS